jgi:hypothetical protein
MHASTSYGKVEVDEVIRSAGSQRRKLHGNNSKTSLSMGKYTDKVVDTFRSYTIEVHREVFHMCPVELLQSYFYRNNRMKKASG